MLAGAQYGLVYPAERQERVIRSGETIKFNAEVASGVPYISRRDSGGTFVIANAGKYVVNQRLYVSDVIGGTHTKISFVLNGKNILSDDIVVGRPNGTLLSFTDVINVTRPNSELSLVNSGADISFTGLIRTVSTISFWGLISGA